MAARLSRRMPLPGNLFLMLYILMDWMGCVPDAYQAAPTIACLTSLMEVGRTVARAQLYPVLPTTAPLMIIAIVRKFKVDSNSVESRLLSVNLDYSNSAWC